MEEQAVITSSAEKLSWEVRELSLGTSGEIERIHGAPSPLRFLRDFVMPNKPCIITHAIDHWPALTTWSNAYLCAALTDQQVSLHSTPDGFADALVDLNRISSIFGCTIETPSPLGTECGAPSPGSHHDVRSFANTAADGRDIAALDLGENSVGEPSAASSQLNCDVNALADDVPMGDVTSKLGGSFVHMPPSIPSQPQLNRTVSNGRLKVESLAAKAMCIDDRDDAHDATCGAVLCAESHSELESSCNQQGSQHPLACDGLASVGQASSPFSEGKLHQAWFVTAHVERVPFSTALDLILHSEVGSGVAYAQQQNGCFLSEYSALAADAETHLPWASEAFGCLPEAVNLWIGNEKAVTSFHKDHYENLYAVIAGEKHFTLLPPTDVHRLDIRKYPSACYVKRHGKFFVKQERSDEFVPWVSVDPYPPPELQAEAKKQFPEYFNGPRPFTCTLQAGEILYLPSMWFHHVRQSPDLEGRTIALNFWYDMQFDVKYAYFNFLESLTNNQTWTDCTASEN